jgi:hypothetical protein
MKMKLLGMGNGPHWDIIRGACGASRGLKM